MTLEGRIHDGTVVFDRPVALAEGTRVRVELIVEPAAANGAGPSLLDSLGAIVGAIDDLPADLAAQHDHYLYGTPKRP